MADNRRTYNKLPKNARKESFEEFDERTDKEIKKDFDDQQKQKKLTGFTSEEFKRGLINPSKFKQKLGIQSASKGDKNKPIPLGLRPDITFEFTTDSVFKELAELGKLLADYEAEYKKSAFYKIYKGTIQTLPADKEYSFSESADLITRLKQSIEDFILFFSSREPNKLDEASRKLFGFNLNPFYNPSLVGSNEKFKFETRRDQIIDSLKDLENIDVELRTPEQGRSIISLKAELINVRQKIKDLEDNINSSRKQITRTVKGKSYIRQFDGIGGRTKFLISMVFGAATEQKSEPLYELKQALVRVPIYESSTSYRIIEYSSPFVLYNKLAPLTEIVDTSDYKTPSILAGNLRPVLYLRWLNSLEKSSETSLTWIEFLQKYDPFVMAFFKDDQGTAVTITKDISEIIKRIEQNTVKLKQENDNLDAEIKSNNDLKNQYIKLLNEKRIRELSLSEQLQLILLELEQSDTLSEAATAIENLQKLYSLVLNQYDLKELVGVAIDCVSKLVPFPDFEKIICKQIIGKIVKFAGIDQIRSILTQSASDVRVFSSAFTNIISTFETGPDTYSNSLKSEIDDVANFMDELESNLDFEALCQLLLRDSPEFLRLVEQSIEKFRKAAEDVSKFELPKAPTFQLPVIDLPDPLKQISAQSEKKAFDTLARAVYSGSISLLTTIIDAACLQDYGYGNQDLTIIIPDNQKMAEVFKRFGIGDTDTSEKISGAMEKLSLILTGTEICSLLNGVPSSRVLKIIKTFMASEYPEYRDVFSDDQRIGDLFLALGTLVDDDVCESIRENIEPLGDNCFENPARNEIRECYLKGVGVDSQRLNELFKELASENFSKLEELIRLADQKDSFSDSLPSPFCDREKVSLFPKNDPTMVSSARDVLDTIFDTVEMSYDQSINSYTKSLLKKSPQDNLGQSDKRAGQDVVQKAVANLVEQYNNNYSPGLKGSFSTSNGEIQNISSDPRVAGQLNSFFDVQKLTRNIDLFKTRSFRKSVQPDLYEKLREGLNELYFYNRGNYSFPLPKTPEEEQAEIFGVGSTDRNLIFASLLPKKKDRLFRVSLQNKLLKDQKTKEPKITDELKIDFTVTETRSPYKSRLPGISNNPNDCRIYTVFLPITIGIATEKTFFNMLPGDTIFPDFRLLIRDYHPEVWSYSGFGIQGTPSDQARVGENYWRAWSDRIKIGLGNDDKEAFWPHAIAGLGSNKVPTSLAFTSPRTPAEYIRDYYDPSGIRRGALIADTDSQPDMNQIAAILEKHWLENVWRDLRIGYTYRVFSNGEAYLVKIDVGRKCPVNVPDGKYAGPNMDLDDWVKFNNSYIGQTDWNKINDRFKIDLTKYKSNAISGKLLNWINPFASFAGVNQGNLVTFANGIPANQKARDSSRPKDKAPGYLTGDRELKYLTKMLTYNFRGGSLKRYWDEIGFTNESVKALLGDSSLRYDPSKGYYSVNPQRRASISGKVTISRSEIPEIRRGQFSLSNILDLGDRPFDTFTSLGSYYFYGEDGSSSKDYTILSEQRRYEQVILLDEKVNKFINDNNLLSEAPAPNQLVSGQNYTLPEINNWETVNSQELSDKTAKELLSLSSKENSNKTRSSSQNSSLNITTFDYVFAKLIRSKWEKRFGLKFPEITDFYLKKPYSSSQKESTLETLRNAFLDKISKFVSYSPLFSTTDSADSDYSREGKIHEVNLLEHIDFAPEPSEALKLCDIDVDLMRFREIKRQTREAYREALNCMQGEFESSELDFVVSVSAAKTIIRLYCVETIMSALFVFSMFNLREEEVDDSLVDYVTFEIIEEIKKEAEKINPGVNRRREDYESALSKYENTNLSSDLLAAQAARKSVGIDFYDSFLEVVARLYIKEILADKNEEIDCENALMELVRKELVLTSKRFKDILYNPDTVKNNNFEPDHVLINDLLFTVALPENESEYRRIGSRFSRAYEANKKITRADAASGKIPDHLVNYYGGYFQPRTGFKNLERLKEIYEYDIGGFYLERYIKPKWRTSTKPLDRALNGYVDIEGMEKYLQSINFGTGPNSNKKLNEYFSDLKFGLRLLYRSATSDSTTSSLATDEVKLYFDLLDKCLKANVVQRDPKDTIQSSSNRRVFMHEDKAWFEAGLTAKAPTDIFIEQKINLRRDNGNPSEDRDTELLMAPWKLGTQITYNVLGTNLPVLQNMRVGFVLNWELPFQGDSNRLSAVKRVKKMMADWENNGKNWDFTQLKDVQGFKIKVVVQPVFLKSADAASITKVYDELVKLNWPVTNKKRKPFTVVTGKDAENTAVFEFLSYSNLKHVGKYSEDSTIRPNATKNKTYRYQDFTTFLEVETTYRPFASAGSTLAGGGRDLLRILTDRLGPSDDTIKPAGPLVDVFHGFTGITPLIEIEENVDLDLLASRFTVQQTNAPSPSSPPTLLQPKDCDDKQITAAAANPGTGAVKTSVKVDLLEEYKNCYEDSLKGKMISSDDYKLLFKSMFPLEKFVSVLTLHDVFYNKNTTNIGDLFNSVKNNIISLMQSIEGIDDINYKDRRFDAVGGDRGLNKVNFKIRGPSPDQLAAERIFNAGLDFALTPFIILKGMAETFDPNIAAAKQVTNLVNSYKSAYEAKARPVLFLLEQLQTLGTVLFKENFPDGDKILKDNQWLLQLIASIRQIPDLPIYIPSIYLMFQGVIPGPQGWIYLLLEPLLGDDLLKKLREFGKDSLGSVNVGVETAIDLKAPEKFARTLEEECKREETGVSTGRGEAVLVRQYTYGGEYVIKGTKKEYIGYYHVHVDGTIMTEAYHNPNIEHKILEEK